MRCRYTHIWASVYGNSTLLSPRQSPPSTKSIIGPVPALALSVPCHGGLIEFFGGWVSWERKIKLHVIRILWNFVNFFIFFSLQNNREQPGDEPTTEDFGWEGASEAPHRAVALHLRDPGSLRQRVAQESVEHHLREAGLRARSSLQCSHFRLGKILIFSFTILL